MKPKYVKRPVADENNVQYLTEQGLPRAIAEVLSSRGINSSNYENFVNGGVTFHSPFEMANMDSAVETINYVMETGGKILIYGDYDADGLTASSILSLFFSDNGVENDVIIPTREEGYGLHSENVIQAFENDFYDLVITVDCGISNADEVDKITAELGVEVIVTDHHELPEVLPNCICVNPKLGYPFPYLAGAGVAWKLVEALAGREVAAKYSDLACIGTVGDIMPMQDENRAIVRMGLENMRHKSVNKLAELSNCSSPITVNDIAMRLAPKINAAGRVGSPLAALAVLLCREKVDLNKVNALLELNEKRKQILEEITVQSDSMCDGRTIATERVVFLYSDRWPHGLLGIVASRYKEKYRLPAVVMTLDGDCYVGSARGIDTLNLFDVFSQCKDCLLKFGGHKASVGFSVSKDKLEEFHRKIVSVLLSYDSSLFETRLYYDLQLGQDCNAAEAIALTEKLQPMLPQDKIICRISDSVKFATVFGKEENHISATLSCGLETKGFFKYAAYVPFIRNGANVDMICSLETDGYTHNPCAIIEDMSLSNSVCFDEFYKLNLMKNFVPQQNGFEKTNLVDILNGDSVAVVFDDYETYLEYSRNYDFSEFFVDIFFDGGAAKTVVVSPLETYSFDRFDKVVYFARKGFARSLPNAVYVEVQPARRALYELVISRDVCAKVYRALRNKGRYDSLKGLYDKFLSDISYCQFMVALRIFEELKLITVADKYTVQFDSSVKRDLNESAIFCAFQQNGEI